jgi:hypothetical protein
MIQAHQLIYVPGNGSMNKLVCQHLADICNHFVGSGLADPKFENELLSGEEQKFWACISEAMIANHLVGKIFPPRIARGKGPDFLIMNGLQKVWVEVTCPVPNDIPDAWRNSQPFVPNSFPDNEIKLRWTSAIKAKADKLLGNKGYLASGIVEAGDAYVIAVNGARLRSNAYPALLGISRVPVAAEVVFSIGALMMEINQQGLPIIGYTHEYRGSLSNKNGAEVAMDTFWNAHFSPISAIWAVDLNGQSVIGNCEPMAVVHNPNAVNPIPLGFFPFSDEYIALMDEEGFTLKKIDHLV